MGDALYPIQMASRLTGLSAHVIRIWEQRHRAVTPRRTPTNRRLYAMEDIDRLRLLRELTQAGHNIGQIARLSGERLAQLGTTNGRLPRSEPGPAGAAQPSVGLMEECLAAVERLDAQALDEVLQRGVSALGNLGFLQRVVAPVVQAVGGHWRQGRLTAAHEHFATAALRVFLGNLSKTFGPIAEAPVLVVATPAGQVHEMGALLASALAANLGWRVTYLGASLPSGEIAGAARQVGARAVALSLVYPEDDPQVNGELLNLRKQLPAETTLLVGGRASAAYRETLDQVGAVRVDDLIQMGEELDRLRRPIRGGRR